MRNKVSPTIWFAFGLLIFLRPAAFAIALEFQPSEYNFGEAEVGTSSTTIVSLSSSADTVWEGVDSALFTPLSSPDFSVYPPVPLPLRFDAAHIEALTKRGDVIYFKANDNSGPELWRSDGTPEGTFMVKDIRPNDYFSSVYGNWGHIEEITNVDGTLFFVANDSIFGPELWKSDGTEAGTMLVKDTYPGDYSNTRPSGLTASNGSLYFIGDSGTLGTELWRSNGTEEETFIILDITEPEGARVSSLNDVGGTLYFQASRLGQRELWRSNGTAEGTERVTDQQFYSIYTTGMVQANGTIFFTATDSLYESGQELWKTDADGTVMVKDIFPGTSEYGSANQSRPFGLIPFSNAVFFHADDGMNGRELWTSDGTEPGTYLFKDINAGAGNGACGWIPFAVVMNEALYFSGNDGTNGCELWKSDGTPEGTFMLKEIAPGPDFSTPHNFHVADGILYFLATDPDHGIELWRSDGNSDGTFMVKDIRPGSRDSRIGPLSSIGGTLYFTADDGVNGQELWRSNGTEATTTMVTEILPGFGPSLNLEVTYTPSSLGPAEAHLVLAGTSFLFLHLFGSGVTVEPPPGEQISEILEFFQASVETGTLSGDGPGNSGEGRLNALTNMIEAADDLIEGGLLSEACGQLQDVYNRCDGLSPPPDFVSGVAAVELANMIGTLMNNLGCE